MTVDQAKQVERLAVSRADPLKHWKPSPVDLGLRTRYADHSKGRAAMSVAMHKKRGPWALVDFNDQRRGRLASIWHWLDPSPEHQVLEGLIEFPPLGHEPLKERFASQSRPI